MQHLDDGTLQSWLDRDRSGISGAEAAEVEAHIAGCEACRARVAELGGTSQEVQALLASVGPGAETPPDFAEVVRRSRRGGASGKGGRRWMAAAWAASIALATGLGWMSHDLLSPGAGERTSTPVAEADGAVDAGVAGAEVAAADLPTNEPVQDIEAAREVEAEGSEVRDAGGAGSEVATAERAAGETVRGEGTEVAAAQVDRAEADRRTVADADLTAEGAGEPERAAGDPDRPLLVHGRVTGSDGRPLAGAQVMVPGTTTGTLSGRDGTFTLSVPTGAAVTEPHRTLALTARSLGYHTVDREVDLTAGDSVSVEFLLQEASISVEGVVVQGLAGEPLAAALRAREADVEAGGAREARPAAPGAREIWVPVARSRAEAEAGFPLLTVPELPVLEVELGEVDGVPAVRVRQALASGATLTLVQWGADRGEVEPTLPEGQAVVTVDREAVRVTGAAPVTLDSLRDMMEGVR